MTAPLFITAVIVMFGIFAAALGATQFRTRGMIAPGARPVD